MHELTLSKIMTQTLKSFNIDPSKITMSWGLTWESIELPEGWEKPPKEEFEAKLQELIDAQPWKDLRKERNRRLADCDWVGMRAFTTNTLVPEEWKTYMQSLRDLPANTVDPENPIWPEAPTP